MFGENFQRWQHGHHARRNISGIDEGFGLEFWDGLGQYPRTTGIRR
jgi:hypothetical protein